MSRPRRRRPLMNSLLPGSSAGATVLPRGVALVIGALPMLCETSTPKRVSFLFITCATAKTSRSRG
eukprot:5254092-Alexandrium_andersonii.AAC.1